MAEQLGKMVEHNRSESSQPTIRLDAPTCRIDLSCLDGAPLPAAEFHLALRFRQGVCGGHGGLLLRVAGPRRNLWVRFTLP